MVEFEPNERVSSPRWGVRRRLEFIEFRLFWSGRLNRSDLSDVFSISAPQASVDIKDYEALAPENLAYDKTLKAFLRTPGFSPIFIGSFADRYLLQIVAIESGWMKKEDTWFDAIPAVEVVTLKRQPTNSALLLKVQDAIRNQTEIEMAYLSMTGSPAEHRSVAPHAMAYAAGKWYVRAWSREHNDFRDYALGRIVDIAGQKPRAVDSALDYEWAHQIDLQLVPNPILPVERQRAIATEYRMVDGQLRVRCRLNLTFYLMSEHNLEVEPGVLVPEKQQLILANRVEVGQARSVARALTNEALRRRQDS